MHSMFLLYQIFILNGFFIVFYEWYNHATNVTCRAESRLRKVSLPPASAAIYKRGDFRKNTVALLLSTVVCAAMVELSSLKMPISQMGKTYRFTYPRPQEVCH